MRWSLILASSVCLYGGNTEAGGGAATDVYDDIDKAARVDVHGLADVYLLHNFSEPTSGRNQLREFDFSDGPALSYLRGTLARRPRRFGFRLDVGAGNTADIYYSQDPAASTHPDLARTLSYFEQAFVTVMLPVRRPIQLDVGRFATPVGLEDNESLTNWTYSRSLLYSWAEPALHAGLRLSCQATDTLAVSLFWVNGWNSVFVDGSDMRSFAAAATWRPSDRFTLILVYMAGLEHPPAHLSGPLSFRNMLSGSIVYAPRKGLSFALAVDYANDRAQGGVTWWGVSGYARLQARPWLAGTLRGEYLADPDGFVTGVGQRLAEATATVELQGKTGRLRIVGRLEVRHDQSSARVFDGAIPTTLRQQDTVTLGLLAAF
jgi:hypothetical protein